MVARWHSDGFFILDLNFKLSHGFLDDLLGRSNMRELDLAWFNF